MKKIVLVAALAAGFGTSAFAGGIGGTWKTQTTDKGSYGHVQFRDCGGKFCAKLVKSFDGNGKQIFPAHLGKDIVKNMSDNGGGSFKGGTIWDPSADKVYSSKMSLSGKSLKVSGCVAKILCKSQTWTRLK
ncbi:MAG: DUF2147 domain-containing protein [Halocynthiibacter sp.]